MIQDRKGKIYTVTGTMGCGKSEELLRRTRRAEIAELEVAAFYPDIAERREPNTINSASGIKHEAIAIPKDYPKAILSEVTPNTKFVVIDEVQFFPDELLEVCLDLQSRGVNVHVGGLDMNFRGEPFSSTLGQIMCVSYEVLKLHAVCMKCKNEEASIPQRLIKNKKDHWVPAPISSDVIAVGKVIAEGNSTTEEERIIYESRCIDCHELPLNLDEN